jgi:uncharacterized protein DUF5709
MRQDNYPHPVSDPEAEGLPDYADDDSDAYERADSPRISDGPDPAALPADRPLGVDRFGTTAAEQRTGESIEYRLAQEEPDVGPDAARGWADEGDALSEDLDRPADDVENIPPIQPNADSQVSMYDIPDETEPVGRIVEPDEGVREDDEKDAIAYDAGPAGGGPTAEEAAIHEVRDR